MRLAGDPTGEGAGLTPTPDEDCPTGVCGCDGGLLPGSTFGFASTGGTPCCSDGFGTDWLFTGAAAFTVWLLPSPSVGKSSMQPERSCQENHRRPNYI